MIHRQSPHDANCIGRMVPTFQSGKKSPLDHAPTSAHTRPQLSSFLTPIPDICISNPSSSDLPDWLCLTQFWLSWTRRPTNEVRSPHSKWERSSSIKVVRFVSCSSPTHEGPTGHTPIDGPHTRINPLPLPKVHHLLSLIFLPLDLDWNYKTKSSASVSRGNSPFVKVTICGLWYAFMVSLHVLPSDLMKGCQYESGQRGVRFGGKRLLIESAGGAVMSFSD